MLSHPGHSLNTWWQDTQQDPATSASPPLVLHQTVVLHQTTRTMQLVVVAVHQTLKAHHHQAPPLGGPGPLMMALAWPQRFHQDQEQTFSTHPHCICFINPLCNIYASKVTLLFGAVTLAKTEDDEDPPPGVPESKINIFLLLMSR